MAFQPLVLEKLCFQTLKDYSSFNQNFHLSAILKLSPLLLFRPGPAQGSSGERQNDLALSLLSSCCWMVQGQGKEKEVLDEKGAKEFLPRPYWWLFFGQH